MAHSGLGRTSQGHYRLRRAMDGPEITPARSKRKGLLREIGAALKGHDHDYTTGSLARAIWLLAVPMVLELSMESVFAICDIFFVSRIGDDAVNLAEKLISVIRGAPEDLLDRYERQRRTVALEYVQAQTNRNRELLNAKDPEVRKGHLEEMRKTAENPELAYPFLLQTSMIASLRRSDSIA